MDPWPWWTIALFAAAIVALAWYRRSQYVPEPPPPRPEPPLPDVPVTIDLEPGETCHYRSPASLAAAGDELGTLYLTNRRAIFSGVASSEAYRWSRVLRAVASADGVRLDVHNHRPVQFKTGDGAAGRIAVHLASATAESAG